MPTASFGSNTGNTAGLTLSILDQSNPNTASDGPGSFYAPLKYSNGSHANLIFTVDLSSLPAGDNVTSARLRLYQDSAEAGTRTFTGRLMLGTIVPAELTWNERNNTANTAWNTAGALGDGTDRDADASFTGSVTATTSEYKNFDANAQGLADLEAAIGVGSISFVLERDGTGNDNTSNLFLGYSFPTDGTRAVFEITHEEPAGGTYTLTADEGAFTLAGSSALVDLSTSMAAGAFAMAGQDLGFLRGLRLTADAAAFAWAGQTITTAYSGEPQPSPGLTPDPATEPDEFIIWRNRRRRLR
jgi:hypothetical protein